ncbi:MAG: heavy metal-responsive transcriptional regulator [Acidobacteria bacterium]|nr:heavy metal-responsive transcriptional regulator [Acidobacteriota bacterium]
MAKSPSRVTRSAAHVGELAAEFGLNPRTIRYYERIGLLAASGRTSAGYRVYGPADRDRLRFILKAKTVGLSLQEIRDVLALRRQGVTPCAHVLRVVEDKLRQLDEHIRALGDFRNELAALRAQAVVAGPRDGCVCGLIEEHEPSHTADTIRLATQVLGHRPTRPT